MTIIMFATGACQGTRSRCSQSRSLVIEGLQREQLPRVTLDFDGSVQSTKGHAEGTAVGFNKNKKGARSYYPLFCTVAQTGQFFDSFHRPGIGWPSETIAVRRRTVRTQQEPMGK